MKPFIIVFTGLLISCFTSGCEKEYKIQKTSQSVDKNKVEVKAVTKDSVYDSINVNKEVLDIKIKEVDEQVKMIQDASKPLK